MGNHGPETRALAAAGYVPPDIMAGLTLFMLGQQSRESDSRHLPGAAGGVSGGVWVRERFTIHTPLDRDSAFTVRGAALGRHVHKGRRYSTSHCQTFSEMGEPIVSNLTTGLLAYRVQEGLEDQLEGAHPDTLDAPAADWQAAASNPCLDALRKFRTGEVLTAEPFVVSLEMMVARETTRPDNPIHSDPELARQAGLARPIAGGSHVLAFVLELIMQRTGSMSLFYGTSIDTRWRTPVYADTRIQPKVTVAEKRPDRVIFSAEATLTSGESAMTSTVMVPLS